MIARLRITNSHPRLAWLNSAKLPSLVPQHVAQQLAAIKTMPQAQDFVRSAGLNVVSETERLSRSATSVTLTQPFEPIDTYHGPQIVLPKIDCPDVPAGTALMNCLLPEIENTFVAERIFRVYQHMVLAFCDKLESRPMACLTGHKISDPKHDLYLRGFRFFFSPDPNQPFDRLSKILQAFYGMTLPSNDAAARRRSVLEYQDLKFCMMAEGKVGHSLLDDVKFYSADTTLVDLRGQ
jgi:hypothetical protein